MPARVAPGSLASDDLSVLFFRVSFDLGLAIEAHRGELTDALSEEDRRLFTYLRERSLHWMDGHIMRMSNADYRKHLKIVSAQIRAEKPASSRRLRLVLEKVARGINARSPANLAKTLHTLSSHAHQLVGEAVRKFGDAFTSAHWSRCGIASLEFQHGEPGPTYCSFSRARDADTITVHVGNHLDSHKDLRKGALRVYFLMQFYLFHEYLSHSYAHWQEPVFVEGYLVWAAREILYELRGDNVRDGYLRESFDALYQEAAGDAQAVAGWFQITSGRKFIAFLLSWAADAEHASDGSHLKTLFQLSERGSSEPDIARAVRQAFQQPDWHQVRRTLTAIARSDYGIPEYSPRYS